MSRCPRYRATETREGDPAEDMVEEMQDQLDELDEGS